MHNHAEPYSDPKTGKDVPFVTAGPFASRDMLFCGIAGDLELYTAEEVISLRNVGIFKSSSSASQPKLLSLVSLGQALSTLTSPKVAPFSPKVAPCSPKIEPDSSSRKQDHKNPSKSDKCPVSMAAVHRLRKVRVGM